MRRGRLIFDVGAELYDWLTWQDTWRAHCRRLVDYFPDDLDAPRVLDLGIGPGVSALGILDRRPGARIVGVDFSPRMLRVARRAIAREGQRIELVQADATALPFEAERFDVVTGHSFLYLTSDRQRVVREAARVLRPGGVCVFLEPAEGAGMFGWTRVTGGIRCKVSMGLWRAASHRAGRFSEDSLRELLRGPFSTVQIHTTLEGLGLLATGVAG